MIFLPDVQSEMEVRRVFAIFDLLRVLSNQKNPGEALMAFLAGAVVILIVYVIIVAIGQFATWLNLSATRLPTLHKKHTSRPTKDARTLKRSLFGMGICCLVACGISLIFRAPAIFIAGFGLSFLVLTIIYEWVDMRVERAQKQLASLLTGADSSQAPEKITLNDIISWKQTIEEGRKAGIVV